VEGAFFDAGGGCVLDCGSGTVVTGRIERGIVKVNDEVEIVGIRPRRSTCTGVEMFRKLLDEGQAGDNVGVLLRGTKREEVERGQCWQAREHQPHTSSRPRCTCVEGGGRPHTPFFKGTAAVLLPHDRCHGAVELPEGTEMVMRGHIKIVVELIAPIAMEQGLRFAIREGGKTVARAWFQKS